MEEYHIIPERKRTKLFLAMFAIPQRLVNNPNIFDPEKFKLNINQCQTQQRMVLLLLAYISA